MMIEQYIRNSIKDFISLELCCNLRSATDIILFSTLQREAFHLEYYY